MEILGPRNDKARGFPDIPVCPVAHKPEFPAGTDKKKKKATMRL
jgi:hypothetical protein